MYLENISNEKLITLYLSRLTFKKNDFEEIENILKSSIEWNKVLEYCINNKVVGLVYYNIEKLNLKRYIPLFIYQSFKFYYIGTKKRNEILLYEKEKIQNILSEKSISCFPLKGSSLLNDIYSDLGTRYMNDLDFLVDIKSGNQIFDYMKSLGYIQGEYDDESNTIKAFSRSKYLTWVSKMNCLPTYMKKLDNEYIDLIIVDFSVSLDLSKNFKAVKEIFESASENSLDKIHFFIQLCCHLYKEATEDIWIYLNADINIIKFCDIREYILKYYKYLDIDKIIEFGNNYNVSESIYFTIYHLKNLYNDGYESLWLDKFNFSNYNFLNQLNINNKKVSTSKQILDRMFSNTNKDIVSDSNFEEKFESFKNM